MRAIWKGSISFGLVSVPVKLYTATSTHDLPMHQVHEKDGGRIRYQRRCEECGKTVEYDDITKAYIDGDTTVMLTEEELKSLPVETERDIEVVEFVPSDQIDPIRLEKSYFLEPEKRALKPYTLLRRTLEETELSAVVRLAIRQRTRLAVLRVHGKVLMVHTMLWDDEIREPEFEVLSTTPRISEKERDMAAQLVETMTGDFTPAAHHDEYAEQLRELVDRKLDQGQTLDTGDSEKVEEDEGAEVVDLMEALKRSVEKSGKKKAGSTGKKSAAKKSATGQRKSS